MKTSLALLLAVPALAVLPAVLPTLPAAAAAPTCDGLRATIVGTPDDDRLVGTRHRDVVVALEGDDTILARGGNDVVCGGAGSDRLEGGPGSDRLLGELDKVNTSSGERCAHGDHLDGGGGDDLLDPGSDPRRGAVGCGPLDEIRFRHGGGGVVVDLTEGEARGQGRDRIVVDQRLKVVGSDGDDEMVGTARDEEFDPRQGDDLVLAGAGRDRVVEGKAANGDDVYDLGEDRDFAVTFRGRDRVVLGTGDDQVISENPARMRIDGDEGDDEISRYAAPDGERLTGGEGSDQLMVVLLDGPGDPADLDIPAALLTVDDATVVAEDFESWIFSAERSLSVLGSDGPDRVTAWSRDNPDGVLTASMGLGDDHVVSDEGDDHVDGGDGTDYADLGDGVNTCESVEEGPC